MNPSCKVTSNMKLLPLHLPSSTSAPSAAPLEREFVVGGKICGRQICCRRIWEWCQSKVKLRFLIWTLWDFKHIFRWIWKSESSREDLREDLLHVCNPSPGCKQSSGWILVCITRPDWMCSDEVNVVSFWDASSAWSHVSAAFSCSVSAFLQEAANLQGLFELLV